MTLNKFLRGAIITGLFIIPLIPAVFSNSFYFPFITGKNFLFRVITEIIFVLWLMLILRDASARPKRSLILWALLATVAVLTLATIFGVNPYRSFWSSFERMDGLITYLHLLALFLVLMSTLNTRARWEKFFFTNIGVAIFVSLYGLIQLTGGLAINQGGARVDATIGNTSYLAIYLVFIIFITLMNWVRERNLTVMAGSWLVGTGLFFLHAFYSYAARLQEVQEFYGPTIPEGQAPHFFFNNTHKWLFLSSLALIFILSYLLVKKDRLSPSLKRWTNLILYASPVILSLGILYNTRTRGAILGFVGGLLLAAILIVIFDKGLGRKAAALLLTLLVLAGAGFWLARNTKLVKESPTLSRFTDISLTESTTKSRLLIWRMSWQGVKERPVLGWGQDNYNLVFNKYYDPRLYDQEPFFDRAHNFIFDWLIAGGVLGLAAYLSIFAAALYLLWRRSALGVVEKGLVTGLLAGYLFQNLFIFDNLISYLMLITVLGWITYWAQDKSAPVTPAYPTRPGLAAAASVVLVPALIIVVYFLNVKPILANVTLIEALKPHPQEGLPKNLELFQEAINYNTFGSAEIRQQLSRITLEIISKEKIPDEIKINFVTVARMQMDEQIKAAPLDVTYHLFQAALLNRLGQYDEAIAHITQARELSPRKQTTFFELADSHINKREYQQAFEILEEAYQLEPSYGEAKKLYALGAIYARRFDIADPILNEIYGTTLVLDDRFLAAYIESERWDRVIKIWQAELAKDPESTKAHLALAAAYAASGQRSLAIKHLEEVKRLDPSLTKQADYYIGEIQAGRNP